VQARKRELMVRCDVSNKNDIIIITAKEVSLQPDERERMQKWGGRRAKDV
jgi:hypothetical protein